MNKFKQCTYTLLLIVTCFVASPFIFHKIWVTSSQSNKPVNAAPPQVGTEGTSDSDAAAAPSNEGGEAVQPTDAPAAQDPAAAPPENAPAAAPTFVSVDASYFDDALFIGDSRTVGIEEYGTLKNADYFCSVGLSASGINKENINGKSFDDTIKDNTYGKVYIMLGINEVGNDLEFTVTAYRTIIEKIKVHQPDAVIYVQGNLHVAASAETNVINNSAINALNSRLESLADNKRVFYIDINEVYDDEYGCLTASYTSDGVHPFAKYYSMWTDWLCTKTVPDANTMIYTEQ